MRRSPRAECARLAQQRALRRRCTRSGTLVLTYDDGPGLRVTPRLLDLLAERSARATFFPLGERAAGAEEVLARAAAERHELGCHGHAHVNAVAAARGFAARDIERGYEALAPWIGPRAIFRPPYGKLSNESRRALRHRGAPLGWWTVDSGDALVPDPRPAPVLRALERAGGGVVLMHDFDRDPPEPVREDFVLDLTGALLDLAQARGWRVTTLGELMA